MSSEVPNSISSLIVQRRARILLIALWICTWVGIGLSVFLTDHFYQIRNGTAGFQSFCNINPSNNCDVVAASPYAEFVLGLPISSFGAGWFLALFLTSLFAWNPFWRRDALRVGLAITGFGTLLSLSYLGIMVWVLKTYCILCLGVDLSIIVALGLVIALKPEGLAKHRFNFSQLKWILGVSALSIFLTVFLLKTRDENKLSKEEITALATQVLDTPPVKINSDGQFPSIGPKDAPITIVEFSDFQCPFCRIGALLLNSVLNRFPEKIRVEFRNFPLDQRCHPEIAYTPHPVACEAATAAICAHQQGQFEKIYQKLFENQQFLISGRPAEYAKSLGVDMQKFEACMTSQETATWIANDIREGNVLSVQSTPVFFINGHKMEGPMPLPVWFDIIERMLKP